MPRIFISHASKDNAVSKSLANCLRNDGMEIWIHYGKYEVNGELPRILKQAIDKCDAFVLLWSKEAIQSRCVKLECQTALKYNKKIIPCLLDETKQSVMTRNFQCFNFISFEQGYQNLIRTLSIEQGRKNKKIYVNNDNQIAKPVLCSPIFRSRHKKLSEKEVNEMLKINDFFDKNRNRKGKGFNSQLEIQNVNHQKIILDHHSGLIWQQGGSTEPVSYKQAKSWIDELNRVEFSGYHNWRLPTLEEAMSLMKKNEKSGDELFINSIFDQTQKWIWTADFTQNGSLAWAVFFNYGCCYVNCFDLNNYVRAVRSE